MRKVLEDLYYGNITPSEKEMRPGSKMQRAVNVAAQCEDQLAEGLDEVKQALLTKLINAQHEIDAITATENFILGFRLGVRLMAECMDDNDGNITEVTDHG